MTPNPILKVLSIFKKFKVKSLLIGGQACIVYGAAEFSRDSDFVILCEKGNIERLKTALKFLKAEAIYVPPLEAAYLEKGHACHFRCAAKDVKDLRIDVISKLRGCEGFDELWKRRNTIRLKNAASVDIINIRDLVQSKKTQRDKDWLMLRRLVENDIALCKGKPSPDRIKWWILQSRRAESLIRLAAEYPELMQKCISKRPILTHAAENNTGRLEEGLREEELSERQKDIEYWSILRKELEDLRHKSSHQKSQENNTFA